MYTRRLSGAHYVAILCLGVANFAPHLSCGWKLGAPAGFAMSVAPVQGVGVEPGLRASLESGALRALRNRGISPGGQMVELKLLHVVHLPEAGNTSGTVGWSTHLSISVAIEHRPDCLIEVSGRRFWTYPPGGPAMASQARQGALDALAIEVTERAIDLVLAKKECR
ncbi:MAG: hypothetical protein HN348_27120 [Proteobacteria bacterium]|nr:hypothetical protein [Pseudomonadota bacterium]